MVTYQHSGECTPGPPSLPTTHPTSLQTNPALHGNASCTKQQSSPLARRWSRCSVHWRKLLQTRQIQHTSAWISPTLIQCRIVTLMMYISRVQVWGSITHCHLITNCSGYTVQLKPIIWTPLANSRCLSVRINKKLDNCQSNTFFNNFNTALLWHRQK